MRLVILAGIFFLGCSKNPSPDVPNQPNNLQGPNWSIYLNSSDFKFDPLSPNLWGSDITSSNFLSAWSDEGFIDNNSFFSGINAADWSNGIQTLKSTVRAALPKITSYTCYNRKKTQNSNCTTSNNQLVCNVLYSNNNGEQSIPCTITTPGTLTTPAQFTACIAPDKSEGCYPDGQGPTPNSHHSKGFYCTFWQTTSYDLTKVNLLLNNIRDNNQPYGCMSPGTVLLADTSWGGLGIGSTCTAEDPGIVNVGTTISNPTFLDPVVVYSNPYNDDQISGVTPLTNAATGSQYTIWNQFLNFCQTNTGFCKLPSGKSRPGIAHLFGRAGPVITSPYVSLVNKIAPNDYSWQYDDKSALIQCNSATSYVVAYFCGGATKTNIPVGPGKRFAVVNNCPQDIWVQEKPVTSVQPNITPQAVDTGDFLVHLDPGAFHVYTTPNTGLQSGNIWAKTGCACDGYHCKTGETEDNSNRPGYDSKCPDPALTTGGSCNNGALSGATCQTNLGPQPDLETKVEFTFGCTAGSGCATTQNGEALGSASYIDVTFVDGFTWPVSIQIIKDSSETSASCISHDAANLSLSQCPTQADLSTRAN